MDQDGVWEHIKTSVPTMVTGYNVSIMAYGQSGTGKSYTMGTTSGTDGIIPRAAKALFDELESRHPQLERTTTSKSVLSTTQEEKGTHKSRPRLSMLLPRRFSSLPSAKSKKLIDKSIPELLPEKSTAPWVITASYVEIYNEQLRDLLATSDSLNLSITEDVKGNIKVAGAQETVVETVDQLLKLLRAGSLLRQTNSTAVNAQSSRSHAIFTIQLTQKQVAPDTGIITTVTSKMNFVDLAGSERLKNTGAEGGRAKEGISINSGLASLGKVISQLSSASTTHISYRDSKLTRLLQDSLGGRAITHLIACVTPEGQYVSETLNTLSYAQRARAIQQTPEIRQVESRDDLRSTIAYLQEELRMAREHRQNSRQDSFDADHATSTTILVKEDDGNNTALSGISGLGNDTTESHKERADRSQEFHKAVEGVIADYEKTISSLQTALLESRAKNREAYEQIAAQNALIDSTNALLEEKITENEALLLELENKNIALSVKETEIAESQANYLELMDISEALEVKLQEERDKSQVQQALFEEQVRYNRELSTDDSEAECEESISPPTRISSPVASSSSSSIDEQSISGLPSTLPTSGPRHKPDDYATKILSVDTLEKSLGEAQAELGSLRLQLEQRSLELEGANRDRMSETAANEALTSKYKKAQKEIEALKVKNEVLENEVASMVAPV